METLISVILLCDKSNNAMLEINLKGHPEKYKDKEINTTWKSFYTMS